MSELFYRPDMDELRQRLRTWWHGKDIGRPVLLLTAPRDEPAQDVPVMTAPIGWGGRYDWMSLEYRLNLAARQHLRNVHLGESVPAVSPDLGPGCLSLYLGCEGHARHETTWFIPCIHDPNSARFEVRPDNFYWQFTLRLAREMLRVMRGKCLLQFPDLIEGLDTLAAMRGTEQLLVDLLDRPQWVHESLRRITDRYFYCYDVLYDMLRDKVGGSVFWSWAPGRMTKLQCDFSAMIGPEMFREFMVPLLTEMSQRVSYCMYHWDGPEAIPHHEALLEVSRIGVIQWQPGAGAEPVWHRRWWPLYHRTLDAGKAVFIGCGQFQEEWLLALKREFGRRLNRFMLGVRAKSEDEAQYVLQLASDRHAAMLAT